MKSKNPKLSLILCTVNRNDEAKEFLRSIYPGSFSVELVIVDQNQFTEDWSIYIDNHNINIKSLTLIHAPKKSLSYARNIGLHYAHGDYIAFPDDDCTYPEGFLDELLSTINKLERSFPQSAGLAVCFDGCKLEPNQLYIKSHNLLGSAISYSVIIKRSFSTDKNIYFNEALGVGNFFGSGEETDFLIRTIGSKSFLVYVNSLQVKHPLKNLQSISREFSYGLGHGALVVSFIQSPKISHFYPIAKLLFGPFAGFVIYGYSLRIKECILMLVRLLARWIGLILYLAYIVFSTSSRFDQRSTGDIRIIAHY